jgi:hypothetical protein
MKNQTISNDSIVIRNLEWLEKEPGLVTVLRPCLGNSKIGKRMAAVFQFDDYRIRLDRIGSAVWKLSNGRTSITEIKRQLASLFPEEDEDTLEERLTAFLHQMNRSRMVTILSPEDTGN